MSEVSPLDRSYNSTRSSSGIRISWIAWRCAIARAVSSTIDTARTLGPTRSWNPLRRVRCKPGLSSNPSERRAQMTLGQGRDSSLRDVLIVRLADSPQSVGFTQNDTQRRRLKVISNNAQRKVILSQVFEAKNLGCRHRTSTTIKRGRRNGGLFRHQLIVVQLHCQYIDRAGRAEPNHMRHPDLGIGNEALLGA